MDGHISLTRCAVISSCHETAKRRWSKATTTAISFRDTQSSTERERLASDGDWCTVQSLNGVKPCPHCRRKVRLSQKTATVALFYDKLPHFFCDSVDRLIFKPKELNSPKVLLCHLMM